jgi:uncharacterized membrane protein YcjF (UPF0283 family)
MTISNFEQNLAYLRIEQQNPGMAPLEILKRTPRFIAEMADAQRVRDERVMKAKRAKFWQCIGTTIGVLIGLVVAFFVYSWIIDFFATQSELQRCTAAIILVIIVATWKK